MNDHAILLVEDDQDDVLLIEHALRKARIEWPLCVVRDGEAAIAYLDGEGPFADRGRFPLPALVLLDLQLPRRTGFEVLDHLRALAALGSTIVVILTNSRENGDIGQAYAKGANSYLVKPIHPGAIENLVSRVRRYRLRASEPPPIFSPAA